MKKLINKVLSHPLLLEKPPVLVDIGASEKINPKWRKFSKYSVCIAFDADDRDFSIVSKENEEFKKLYKINRIVTINDSDSEKFYLTKSPYCSSLLKPDLLSLSNYSFFDKFEIDSEKVLPAIRVSEILNELNIGYVDWFKSDSQGTDLRLFLELSEKIYKSVIVAEFEPGIIDAYFNEDKMTDVMIKMNELNFWCSDIIIKGSVRMNHQLLKSISGNKYFRKLIQFSLKTSPGWAEILYFNSFKDNKSLRDYLLGWIFAISQKQYGFAFELADKARKNFNDPIVNELFTRTKNMIKYRFLNKNLILQILKSKL
ncbi:hypothetical protein [Ignavibacterium album]|uniref:hypothetical protein n=1 Tax=Ignavibacterium album TaxID=591197 RepID=UPI0035B8D5D8